MARLFFAALVSHKTKLSFGARIAENNLMLIDQVKSLLERCSTPATNIPPTDLYNEGWMLRLVLDWLHRTREDEYQIRLPFPKDAGWYSEALLPSAFFARRRGDKLAESRTHADGVIGDFTVGDIGKGDFSLRDNAKCFVVVEAKMFSKLSSGVSNARYYNQAARNVACMAEVIRLASVAPQQLSTLGFYVVAPLSRIEEGIFDQFMSRQSITENVERRVSEYGGEKTDWHDSSFIPTFAEIAVETIAWEDVVSDIAKLDPPFGSELKSFYGECLRFNSLVADWTN